MAAGAFPNPLALILRTCQDGVDSLLSRGHTYVFLGLRCQVVLALFLKMLSDCWLERIVSCADAHSAARHSCNIQHRLRFAR